MSEPFKITVAERIVSIKSKLANLNMFNFTGSFLNSRP
jgi:hypothetical protein